MWLDRKGSLALPVVTVPETSAHGCDFSNDRAHFRPSRKGKRRCPRTVARSRANERGQYALFLSLARSLTYGTYCTGRSRATFIMQRDEATFAERRRERGRRRDVHVADPSRALALTENPRRTTTARTAVAPRLTDR